MRQNLFLGMGLLMILACCNNTNTIPNNPSPRSNSGQSGGYYNDSDDYNDDYADDYPEYTWTGPGYYWGIWFDNEWDFNNHHHHGNWNGHHGNWNGGGHHGGGGGGGHHGGGGGGGSFHGGGGHGGGGHR